MSDPQVLQARTQIRVYSASTGLQTGIIDNWRTLEWQRKLNGIDLFTLGLQGNDAKVSLLTLDTIVELWRQLQTTPRSDWYLEGIGFHRTLQQEITEANTPIAISYGRGLIDLIRRRTIAYNASTAYTFKGAVGETVIKEFVNENAGPGANDVNRKGGNGVTFGLSIEPTAGRGVSWSGQISWQNLLTTIQEVALQSGVDFDIVRTGATSFEFRCYYPQLGTDRSLYVTFSPTLGNMLAPSYTKSRTEEVNRIIVLGQGEDASRRTYVVDDAALQAESLWNVIEQTYDDRKDDTLAALIAAGAAQLKALAPQESFTFRVLQTSSLQYGRDYFLGDRVTTGFGSYSTTKKITGVTLNISEGRESIACEFATIPAIA